MYNKLFTKILDSTIWMEPESTRIVWITLLAAMDEDGFVAFPSLKVLAHRAIVSFESAETAIATLAAPDPDSSSEDHEGRRIEIVQGGYIVLNAKKYRDLSTREKQRTQTAERVRRHREKKTGNADVTQRNDLVTTSYTEAYSNAEEVHPCTITRASGACLIDSRPKIAEKKSEKTGSRVASLSGFDEFYTQYPKKVARKTSEKSWKNKQLSEKTELIVADVVWRKTNDHKWLEGFIPNPATYLNQERWTDERVTPEQAQQRWTSAKQTMSAPERVRLAYERQNHEREQASRTLDNQDCVAKDGKNLWP